MASAGRIVTKTSQALSNNITKNAPASWQALLAHPPPPSLTRGVIQRSADDLPSKLVQSAQSQGRRRKAGKDLKARLKPQPIVWKEDYIVDKLYADHPWERHRAISVTESGELDNEQLPDSQDLSLWSPKPSIFL